MDTVNIASPISCIVPTHSRPAALERCLQSISRQSIRPFEIIVSDDVGDINTRGVVEKAGMTYLDSHEGSSGTAGGSRNSAAKIALGSLLAFLDDDDFWAPTYLERMVAALEESGSDFVVAWGSLRVGESTVEDNWRIRPGATFAEVLTQNPGFTGSNFLIRRDVFERLGGFDPKLRVFNDLDLLVRLIDAGATYAVVDDSLVTQTSDGASHLSSRGERRARGIKDYRKKWSERLAFGDRRRLLRHWLVAMNFPGQSPVRRVGIMLGLLVTSDVDDFVYTLKRRLKQRPNNYA